MHIAYASVNCRAEEYCPPQCMVRTIHDAVKLTTHRCQPTRLPVLSDFSNLLGVRHLLIAFWDESISIT